MRTLGTTILEVVVICAVAAGLGLAVNTLRAENSLKIGKNHFAKIEIPASGPAEPEAPAGEAGRVGAGTPANDATGAAAIDANLGVQVATFECAREWFDSPDVQTGDVVFIDARDDDAFREGHIAGAVQFDHYHADKYLPNVLPLAAAADRIVIYCAGGECEDSLFATRDLLDAGIPFECIYLYKGGWEEWEANDLPSEVNGN